MRTRRAGVVAVAVAIVASGCGVGGVAEPSALPGASEQLLTRGDVDRYPVGTPPHALLAWWRNAQYANYSAYVRAFDDPLRRRLEQDRNTPQVLTYFAGSIRNARPRVQGVLRNGDRATVYTMIEYRNPVGTREYVVSRVPKGFEMVQKAGNWLLVDDHFVQSNIPAAVQQATGS